MAVGDKSEAEQCELEIEHNVTLLLNCIRIMLNKVPILH